MGEKTFSLLKEPWIRVVTNELEDKEVSLTDFFTNAHNYRRLSGETPAYDAAMIRFLIAITSTVVYRYSTDGKEELLTPEKHTPKDVLNRWEDYWKPGHFNSDVFTSYLEKHAERFWLFHPTVPFYQVPGLKWGTEYKIRTVVGTCKESNTDGTRHLFSIVDGEGLQRLTFAEAARCLLFYNSYAVNVKPVKKDECPGWPYDSVSVSRMGDLGFIMAEGKNLFETLLLNLCALRDGETIWESPRPVWEEPICDLHARLIPEPDNMAALCTLQSRRLCWRLGADKKSVIKLQAMAGDYYPLENCFAEQMTVWTTYKTNEKTEEVTNYRPKRHAPGYHLWREFSNIVGEGERTPGLIRWLSVLAENGLTDATTMLTIRSVGVKYQESMRYNYEDLLSDGLTLSLGLLTSLGEQWKEKIVEEVQKCAEVDDVIGKFTWRTTKLIYGRDKPSTPFAQRMSAAFYSKIDSKFRQWLYSIQPDTDIEEKTAEWEQAAYQAALEEAGSYMESLGNTAFKMKTVEGKKSPESILDAYNWYEVNLRKIYSNKKIKKEENNGE